MARFRYHSAAAALAAVAAAIAMAASRLFRAERLRCADCGRVVPVYTVRRFDGESVCDRCYIILD